MSAFYSIWLIPSLPVFTYLRKIILKLALENDAPVFLPHITLIGGIRDRDKALKGAAQVVEGINKFQVILKKIRYETIWSKALYFEAERNEDLVGLFSKASRIFLSKGNFQPHLSLLYGTFPPVLKKRIIKELGSSWPKSFVVKRIDVYRTGDKIEDAYKFKKIAEFKIKRSS